MALTFGFTTMSSKGQIVIPKELRKSFKQGDKVLLMYDGQRLVMKRTTLLEPQLIEDIAFAKRTEEAYQRYLHGDFKQLDKKEFLRQVKKW